jgi:hypothetical protein
MNKEDPIIFLHPFAYKKNSFLKTFRDRGGGGESVPWTVIECLQKEGKEIILLSKKHFGDGGGK